VIPEQALFRGTIRTYSEEVLAQVSTRAKEIVENIATAMNCEVQCEIETVYPATINHPENA
jgi:hippurate hydrolase